MSTVSVRYIVDDVDAAIAFYRDRLGFREQMHPDPAFAMLTLGDLRLVLVAPVPAAGVRFRNEIVTGVGTRQVMIEDPSGNPVELFEPLRDEARLERR